jgi:hypothetical protein
MGRVLVGVTMFVVGLALALSLHAWQRWASLVIVCGGLFLIVDDLRTSGRVKKQIHDIKTSMSESFALHRFFDSRLDDLAGKTESQASVNFNIGGSLGAHETRLEELERLKFDQQYDVSEGILRKVAPSTPNTEAPSPPKAEEERPETDMGSPGC